MKQSFKGIFSLRLFLSLTPFLGRFTSSYVQQTRMVGISKSYQKMRSNFLMLAKPENMPSLSESAEPSKGNLQAQEDSAFSNLGFHVIYCLIQSDLKRLECNDGASAGWTSWIDQASEFRLRSCIDRISLLSLDADVKNMDLDGDEAGRWLRWMKSSPAPLVIELSPKLRASVSDHIYEEDLLRIDSTKEELLDRIGCRVILLPSGKTLNNPFQTPTGGMAFGKLLYGGVTRFRLLSGGKRRTGERTLIMNPPTTNSKQSQDHEKCWVQYGGPERKYEAVDIGPAAVIEIIMLPKGLIMSNVTTDIVDEMTLSRLPFDLDALFCLKDEKKTTNKSKGNESSTEESGIRYDDFVVNEATEAILKVSGKERNNAFRTSFVSKVGGLQPQIETIVRRVLDGRVISKLPNNGPNSDNTKLPSTPDDSIQEAKELAALGLNPVRGMLLYGKPGCGKTALVREIALALKARPPKIVAAPELLDRWVGGSEKLVRELFRPAELELGACNGDASKSALHIVVIDEIDAVFRKRSASSDSGESTRSSVVNQILAKMDGVHALSNVLVIGMTNRRELLDDALLRPGRLEVQVEIPKPNKGGRREILQIHFNSLRKKGRLSKPLCEAIDGTIGPDIVEEREIVSSFGKKRRALKRTFDKLASTFPLNPLAYDLAVVTEGFSGADIAGLVRCAGSIALSRARLNGSGIEGLFITLEDVKEAIVELKR